MAATNKIIKCRCFALRLVIVLLGLCSAGTQANVLPDQRVDLLYHGYDGGGAQIDGPSILVRKNFGNSVSVSANYYVDMVSSASIDVEATASPYSEKRTEYSVNTEYLHDRTTLRLGYANSTESDYEATTYSFGISQTFFGDLTTIGMGVSFGEDIVGQNDNPEFMREVERRRYSVNLSQILTKNLIAAVSVEHVADQGFLNNPYRSVRYLDDSGSGYSYQPEIYPETHNSDAIGIRAIYHLPYRAALRGDYRVFSDSWGIDANNWELRYTHPYKDSWLFEVKYRAYEQTAADFYSDLFPYRDAQNFLARDKELSPFTSSTIGLGITYQLPFGLIPGFDKSTANLYWDYMDFDYEDFRDVRVDATQFSPGQEPLYRLKADVIRLYFSFWY